MSTWESFYNLHEGESCIILGKGPSADIWAKEYNGNEIIIAINDAGKIWQAHYNISRHNWIKYGTIGQWFLPVVDGWELNNIPYKKVNFRRPVIEPCTLFIPMLDGDRKVSREDMRDLRIMPTPGGSAVNATMLAYYMGFESIQYVGVDGGSGYAQNTTSELAYRPGGVGYDALRKQTEYYAKKYFGDNYSFASF